ALAVVDALQRLGAGTALRLLAAGTILAGVCGLAVAGVFDALSIAREYASRRLLFFDALSRHVALVMGSVSLAVVIGFPLGVVAALIGAGGLGTFVFEGLGQYAVDLVLLGALPAIFLALAADFMLQTLSAVLRRAFSQ